eukprot:TRINITY_DN4313_c0_g1_i1.p1 TRINITY_DN4313_c0_g1~~TRINITY_DN4313_c0_g1_i1.p1  ORF type:complete len:456 (+),score=89.40 TRINITY_DN4313_c0_g1_i1:139-1506(+)
MKSDMLALLMTVAVTRAAAEDEEKCAIASVGTKCNQAVMDAMRLSTADAAAETFADLQETFWKSAMYSCPRPCQPQEQACVKFSSSYPCYEDVKWATEVGLPSHPEWYPNLHPGASFTEAAKLLYRHGQSKCARPCDSGEAEGHSVPYSHTSTTTSTSPTPEAAEDMEIERLTKIIMHKLGKNGESHTQDDEEVDDCAKPGITYSNLDMHSAPSKIVKGVTACHMHCKGVDGAGYFLFYRPLKWCHCVQVEVGMQIEEQQADNNYVGGSVECPKADWEETNAVTAKIVQRVKDSCYQVDTSYSLSIGEALPVIVDTSLACQKKLQSSDDKSAAHFSFEPSTGACRIIPKGASEITAKGVVSGPRHCEDEEFTSVVMKKFEPESAVSQNLLVHKARLALGILAITLIAGITSAALIWRRRLGLTGQKQFSPFLSDTDADAEQGLRDGDTSECCTVE